MGETFSRDIGRDIRQDNVIQWDICEAQDSFYQGLYSRSITHTIYRGMHVHDWYGDFFCFYPAEGNATAEEMIALHQRIIDAGLNGLVLRGMFDGDTLVLLPRECYPHHRYTIEVTDMNGTPLSTSTCSLRERIEAPDTDTPIYCLETKTLKSLDMIIEGLYAQTWEQVNAKYR